jgi:CheY-like chemotaxis protein
MQLILAIDTDRRQASQLASLVRARLTVDLVQATSAGEALQALGDRVPDLILTPALLSPFDDGVLAEYLRELGPAGAHVQTLRIPVLGAPVARASKWALLFRRKKPAQTSTPGCDPDVFADEISLYLTRAAHARQATDLLGGQDRGAGSAATAAWDMDSRRAQEPLRTLPDQEWSAPVAWDEPATWQEPSTWQEPAAEGAPPRPAGPVDEPAGPASEWDVMESAIAAETAAPVDPPNSEPVDTRDPGPSVAPAPTARAPRPGTEGDAGSPSFEAALAAIRAAWEAPKDGSRTRERSADRAASSLR